MEGCVPRVSEPRSVLPAVAQNSLKNVAPFTKEGNLGTTWASVEGVAGLGSPDEDTVLPGGERGAEARMVRSVVRGQGQAVPVDDGGPGL